MREYIKQLCKKYVIHHEGARELGATSEEWPVLPHSVIVYRAHKSTPRIYSRQSALFSASYTIDNILDEFAGPVCCIFKIHLPPGTHYINVNDVLGKEHRMSDENEIIFESGGEFTEFVQIGAYKNRALFETYYMKNIPIQKEKEKRNLRMDVIMNRFGDEEDLFDDKSEFINYIKSQIQTYETISKNTEAKLRRQFGLKGGVKCRLTRRLTRRLTGKKSRHR
jgi:hypothetical protein